MKKGYLRYFAMILTSAVLMYGVMYLNTYEIGHVYFSETRLYMTILSTCVMAIVMLLFMLNMLSNRKLNIVIVLASIIIFSTSFVLMRNQSIVDDVDYMQQMIPHHSIAILTSENADLSDPRVKQLAEDIIKAQEREIEMMSELIVELEDK